MSFASATTYPLANPTHYDDDYGEGYGFAAVADDIPEGMEMTMVDCWIVNDAGERHPGLSECPVPVRFCDVVADKARPSTEEFQRAPFRGWA